MSNAEFDFVYVNARDAQEICRDAGEMMDQGELRQYIARSMLAGFLSDADREKIARTVEAEVGVRMVMA